MAREVDPNSTLSTGSSMSGALGTDVRPKEDEESLVGTPVGSSSTPATIGASQPSQPSMPMPKQPKAGTGTFANLRSYLQAAQGGGQQRVAQAATQQVQKLGAGAQKGTQQAQKTFGTQMEAGSLKGMETAAQEAKGIVGTARGTTYQAPPAPAPQTQAAAPALTQEQINEQNKERRMLPELDSGIIKPYNPAELAKLWEDKIRNPDGTISYKDGRPLGSDFRKTSVQSQNEGETPITSIPAQTQPQQYFTPEQTQRFAEIINAQYQGPASLQQAGLYEQAAQKARTAQEAAQKTQTALGREQLLKDVFGRTREYGRGVSKLDALLLNASQQGVKQLQEQAQPAAKAQEALQTAQNLSTNEAAQRQAAIEGIRSGARQELTGARAAEEQAVENRLSQVVANWEQLPDYYREMLKDREKGAMNLSQQEADILGIKAGEGLYNLTPEELIKTNVAEKERLISKNELSRQLALSQLAGTDVSNQLQKDMLYSDLSKAGTQTAEDALDKAGIRDVLNAQEKAFREQAAGQNIVGEGSKKHKSSGKRYYAEETANLKDLLEKAGYDFNADIGSGAFGSVETDKDAPEANKDIGQVNLGGVTDPYSSNQSALAKAAYGLADTSTGGVTAGLRALGIDPVGAVTGALGLSGPSSRYAKNIASQQARADLQRRVTETLNQAGFANRTAIADNEQTKARQAALQEILAAREKLRG